MHVWIGVYSLIQTDRRKHNFPVYTCGDLTRAGMHLVMHKDEHKHLTMKQHAHRTGGMHSLDVTLREHRPFFEPMTGSLGTTPSIHHQLDSAGCRHGDCSAPACCTLASAPNPNYTRNSPPPLSHCAASFCTVNSKAPGGHGGSNSRLPPPTPALSPLRQVDEFKDFPGPTRLLFSHNACIKKAHQSPLCTKHCTNHQPMPRQQV
jgi:hypothetical protein